MKITGTLLMFVVTTQLFTGCTKKRQNPSSEELIETIELSSVPEDSGKAVEAQPIKEPSIEQAVVEEPGKQTDVQAQAPAADIPAKKEKPAMKQDKKMGDLYYQKGLEAARKKDFKTASQAYLNACQYGNAQGCHKFGWQLQKSGNLEGAAKFYSYACEKGVRKSCNNIGFIAEKSGKLEKAQDYYSWGCIKGYAGSCQSLKRVNTQLRQAH